MTGTYPRPSTGFLRLPGLSDLYFIKFKGVQPLAQGEMFPLCF